ncbi:VOC family protein [Nocardia jiangxiensis]|uniref:VOC family protein n=1 Tax=Nocardia jiangxiensis TaxID=282685 RepID=A0ABW6SB60_9NOCA|nr:VOC family protein [Nocardia jiangxiensis]
MSTRLACVVFDVASPRQVARFWAELLGWQVTLDRPGEVDVAAPDPDALDVALSFVPARTPKVGKNRIHLDLASQSLDHQGVQVDRALSLGARRIDIGQGAVPWVVLADPEGNEFCVLEPREEYVDTGAVAAIVVDTTDPSRLAAFWSTASGWPITHERNRYAGIRSATEQGPWLEFLQTHHDPKNPGHLHLDLVPFFTDDPAREIERLCAAGARTSRPGDSATPPITLADPETYEFRLLRPHQD